VIDEELANPQAFALAVRARASFLARETLYEFDTLRPYAQLTLLLGMELTQASELLRSYGLRGALRSVVSQPQKEPFSQANT
jgi:hypothetical protein